ncbi:MAG: hypothetical protein GY835_13760 [bacterium]|nr:hypothetical protein [bacterium]
MNSGRRFRSWIDVRPGEGRGLIFSTLGAFFCIGAMTLGRAMREAVYLSQFSVESLPYIMGTVALLSLPVVRAFTRLLELHPPRRVMNRLVGILILGLTALWPLAVFGLAVDIVVIAFYIWTALGILLMASGFWVVTSELFAVRGAKRLFGLISAGGTAGALVIGVSLNWLSGIMAITNLFPLLIGLLLLFLLWQKLLPPGPVLKLQELEGEKKQGPFDNLKLIWSTRHLRIIALIVISATMASTLVDYQFKETVTRVFADSDSAQADMTAFFGSFYGWTGGIALLLQMLVSGRLIAARGVGAVLILLPLFLLAGSAGLALLPGLFMATLLRGGDNALRKSIFRPAIEILYLPLSVDLRRRTKTFIDTVLDTLAEGLGAVVIFVLITTLHLPSGLLSLLVALLAIIFIVMSRRMDRQYLKTIIQRLKDEAEDIELTDDTGQLAHHPLDATFTRLDLHNRLADLNLPPAPPRKQVEEIDVPHVPQYLEQLRSADLDTVRQAIARNHTWDTAHLRMLLNLLARDAIKNEVTAKLVDLGFAAEPLLTEVLIDETRDFVIRRRIPRVFALTGRRSADDALLTALTAGRFEIRYRAALALVKRQRHDLQLSLVNREDRIWAAVRAEVARDKPVWELQKLFDGLDRTESELVNAHVDERGTLSLEHTFRMLSLVLEQAPVRAAFNGILLNDEMLNNYALEYLEQVLPGDIKERLWQFIGDVSEHKRDRSQRMIDDVVSDLMESQVTLFAGDKERAALLKLLQERDEKGR